MQPSTAAHYVPVHDRGVRENDEESNPPLKIPFNKRMRHKKKNQLIPPNDTAFFYAGDGKPWHLYSR